jgi:tight adherence protein C
MDSILPFGITTLDIITMLAGIAAFVAFFAVWNTAVVRDPMRGRVKQLQDRREALKTGYVAAKKRKGTIKKVYHMGFMRGFVNKLKLMQEEKTQDYALFLARAGYRSKDALIMYVFSKALSPILGLILGVVLVFGMNMFFGETPKQALLILGLLGLGMYAPDIFIKNAVDKRTDAIRLSLPDALDLLVICAEAGLTLDAALNRVSKELANASPELADEFTLTSLELGFMPERRQALKNLADRVNLKAVKSVVTTLVQTEKYGTPLSQSLRVLSAEFRNDRMMKAEEKAAKLPAVMTIPLILFILPVLFIVLLGPAACSVSDNFLNRGF